MAMDYAGILYVLASMFGSVSPTQPDGSGAPTAYQWVFKPSTGPDTPVTYTIEKGSSYRASKWVYSLFTSLGFTLEANNEASDISGSILAQKIDDGISMTGSPTTVEAVPVLPEHWNIYIAATETALDSASALDEVLTAEFSYGEKFSPMFNVARNTTFADVAEKYADIGGTLSMMANSDAMGYLTTLRNLTEQWIRFEAVGDTIAASETYVLQIDMPIYFSALPSFGDSNDVYAANFAFVARKDATLASAVQFTVENTISAL
jgi:hypothetical protein